MTEFVFFDAGGTLIRPHPSVGAVYATAGARFGLAARPDDLTRAFSSAFTARLERIGPEAFVTDDETAGRRWWRGLVDDVLDTVGFHGDRAAVFDACYSAFDEPRAWRVFEDVRPALDALKRRGLRLGVLSNWDTRLEALLDRLQLSPFFDEVVVSCREGCAKPDPRLFSAAEHRVGVSSERIAYVGDRPELDLEAGLRAGWNALLIDRRPAGEPGPRTLRSLDELASRI